MLAMSVLVISVSHSLHRASVALQGLLSMGSTIKAKPSAIDDSKDLL